MAQIHCKIEAKANNEAEDDFDIRDINRDFIKLLEQAELLKVKMSNMDNFNPQAQIEMNINYKQRRQSMINNSNDDEDLYMK